MIEPTFEREEKLFSTGTSSVAGVDEAGRGPLAGPVVAASVYIDALPTKELRELVVRDSKKMTLLQREKAFELLTSKKGVTFNVGVVGNNDIDDMGILPATLFAMKKAVLGLSKEPQHVLIDGRSLIEGLSLSQTAAPRLDGSSWVCAAASIIAKVTRDRIMIEHHDQYPVYGFDRHKGYGTAAHREAIEQYGPCEIHRQTFTLLSHVKKMNR